MEIIKVSVVLDNGNHFIKIGEADHTIRIPMSEDKPNDVKSAFNRLIVRLKNGEFELKMDEVRDDLFSQVANEYITQLNKEIKEVYGEMERYGLLEADVD
jgi:hypothetical protein